MGEQEGRKGKKEREDGRGGGRTEGEVERKKGRERKMEGKDKKIISRF